MSRRKNKLKYLSIEQLLVFIITVIISMAFIATKVWVGLFIVVPIGFLTILIFGLPVVKGKFGEKEVSRFLNRLAKKHDGYLINDVIIPTENGTTSQIDHVLIIPAGVFVVETKNYSGRIYGNDQQEHWVQILNYGKVKNKLYSPVKQNLTHIYNLSKIIGDRKISFINIVIFTQNNIRYIDSENVYTKKEIKQLASSETLLNDVQIQNVYSKINEYKENPISTTKQHVVEIKQKQRDIQNGICPRCGGTIVLRRTKDGRTFYGCSNYPKCKFIKKD